MVDHDLCLNHLAVALKVLTEQICVFGEVDGRAGDRRAGRQEVRTGAGQDRRQAGQACQGFKQPTKAQGLGKQSSDSESSLLLLELAIAAAAAMRL